MNNELNKQNLCTADLHLHTNLSFCAPDTTKVSSYLPFCSQENIKRIGISNHLYSNRGVEYILQIKEELDSLQDDRQRSNRFDDRLKNISPEILLGCEAELFYGKEPQLTKKDTHHFDYVLIAASHIFNKLEQYKDFDLSNSEKIRDLLIENFQFACHQDLGVPTGICHPLYPICAPNQQEILNIMTDEQLVDCYSLAAKKDISIEIHACLYRNTVELDGEGLSPSYIRMLSIAKECGCKFHFGSDAHSPDQFVYVHRLLERAAERAGITENDLWHLARM